VLLALDGAESVLKRALERSRDEPVLGLARVELTSRAVSLELSTLESEPLTGEACLVLILELADRAPPSRRPRLG
jgi:hypothetical protein